MIANRWACLTSVCFLAISCFGVAAASAQDRLAPGVVTNPNSWTPAERSAVSGFINGQIQTILSDDVEAVSRARRNLADPLDTQGATESFLRQYSQLLTERLTPLVENDDLKTRINTMVIFSRIGHPDALDPIERGLTDPSPGVRYPAALAMNNQIDGGELTNNQIEKILDLLKNQIVAEKDAFVVAPLLEAMLAADQSGARVIDVLNDRVAIHAEQPGTSYSPENAALQLAFSRLFTAAQRPQEQVRSLAKVSARYLQLAARQLAEADLSTENNRSHIEAVRVAASSLEFAHTALRARGLTPQGLGTMIDQENWVGLRDIAQEWVEILKQDPFNFTDQDLALPPASPQAARR
ncbi:MAG: hypothetical protein AAGG38_04275 [Planctomycetota bacterium]